MQYLGGKFRQAKRIAGLIAKYRRSGQLYIEPFIGGGNIFHLIERPKIGGDIDHDLIVMWQAVATGWLPPLRKMLLTSDEYDIWRNSPQSALRSFVAFGCSFGGKSGEASHMELSVGIIIQEADLCS